MKYYVPDLRVPAEAPVLLPTRDKFGGLPWGLAPASWPICSCGGAQSFLAQFGHDPARLDLGRPGRVLFVFQCDHDPGGCATWEGGSGANACFVVEPEDLSVSETPLPPNPPERLETDLRVVAWLEKDDGIAPEHFATFFDENQLRDLPDEFPKPVEGIRLGSVPLWIQSPSEAPEGDWRFVGQLDSQYQILVPPKDSLDQLFRRNDGSYACEGPNFGDGGIAYLFLRNRENATPEGWFFWQCG